MSSDEPEFARKAQTTLTKDVYKMIANCKYMNKKLVLVIEFALIVLSLLATMLKVQVGMDIDEAYIVTMGIRLLQGDELFRNMWELHQTSAWPIYVVLCLLIEITESLNRAVLVLRIVSVLFSAFVAASFHFVMKKYYKNCFLVSLFIFNFLPRGTQNFEYGYLTCMFGLLSSVILFYLIQEKEKLQPIKLLLLASVSGCLASIGWLCYPTMILTAIVVYIVLRPKKYGNFTALGGYFIGCIIVFSLFFLNVFRYSSLTSFLHTLPRVLSDGSHEFQFTSILTNFLTIKYEQLLLLTFFGLILVIICRLICKQWIHPIYAFLFIGSFVVMALNITGLRPCGVFGLQIRLLIVTVVGSSLLCKMKENVLYVTMFLPGILMLVGALLGSNLGVDENCGFLFLALVAVLLCTCNQISEFVYNCFSEYLAYFCVVIFVLATIFFKGYIVRVTGTGPASIMEKRVVMNDGPLQGIYISGADFEKNQERISLLSKYAKEEDVLLLLGTNALDNIYSGIGMTTPTCISTPRYDIQWVSYFQDPIHKQPSLLLLDKETVRDVKTFFNSNEFGQYLMKRNPVLCDESRCYYLYWLDKE